MTDLLINPERLRASLRRLFSNDWNEIAGELLQNAQRACASRIAFRTTETGFTAHDDGHGVRGGIDGVHTLLSLGDSAFAHPAIADQHPLGLGVHALLAAEGVQQVSFASGSLAVTIDAARWWSDTAYVAAWRELVTPLAAPVAGLRISVTCAPAVTAALVRELRRPVSALDERSAPQHGYDDLLSVTLDGERLDTAVPAWLLPQPIVETSYLGCRLTVGASRASYRAFGLVNWYGQLIIRRAPVAYYLHVRAGRPVNPLAPTRRGLIADQALAALERCVEDALFAALAELPVEQIDPDWLELAFRANRSRALLLPVCLVAPYLGLDSGCRSDSIEDLGRRGPRRVVRTSDAPPLLRPLVRVATATLDRDALRESGWPAASTPERPPWIDADYGIDAFITLLQPGDTPPCELLHGDEARLAVHTLWWQPGAARPDAFNLRGSWGLALGDAPPERWQPVDCDVFAFTTGSNCAADEVDWAVGCDDPLQFLEGDVWCGYSCLFDSELSTGEQEQRYRDSIAAWKRQLVGDCVSRTFSCGDLLRLLPDPDARITRITPLYTDDSIWPCGIQVENQAGQHRTLRFLD